jgi:hypothetical protein
MQTCITQKQRRRYGAYPVWLQRREAARPLVSSPAKKRDQPVAPIDTTHH